MSDYVNHEVADLFPMMGEAELVEFAEDISQNGLLEPILVIGNQIIDGRNRYKACQMVGVTPVFKEYEGDQGDNLVHLSMSLNLQRRHLTKSQKALVAFKLQPMLEKFAKSRQIKSGKEVGAANLKLSEKIHQADDVQVSVSSEGEGAAGDKLLGTPEDIATKKGRSANQAGDIVGVNGRYVSDVKRIAEESPELLKDIESGDLSVSEAKKMVLEKVKSKPGYVKPDTKKVLMINLPASCHTLRSALMDLLKKSIEDCPDDVEVHSLCRGKVVEVKIVDKPVYS